MTQESDIHIYIDFKSAAAHLAMQPTLEWLEAQQLKASWHPVMTRQRAVPEPRAGETKGERHIRIREAYRRKIYQHYAQVQGIPLSFPAAIIDSELALAGLEASHSLDFAQRAFDAYWREHKNLNDRSVVNELLTAAGAQALPDDAECARLLQAAADRVAENGVIDAPAYLVGEELFIGREHLALLKDLLKSK